MKTSQLSIREQKNNSSKSKNKPATIKNTLISPEDEFLPIVKKEDQKQICDLLAKLLPAIKSQPNSVPWKILKSIPKEERNEFRKKICNSKVDSELQKTVVRGINSVIRSLEKENVSSVLFAKNVNSAMMKPVLSLCAYKQIPILVLESLREITLEHLGYSCITLGFKYVSKEHHYWQIIEMIKKLSETEYKLPKPHMSPIIKPTENVSPKLIKKQNVSSNKTPEIKIHHLQRSSTKERAFVPPIIKNSETNQMDFIPLNNSVDKCKRRIVKEDSDSYIPAKIKKIQGRMKNKKKKK